MNTIYISLLPEEVTNATNTMLNELILERNPQTFQSNWNNIIQWEKKLLEQL